LNLLQITGAVRDSGSKRLEKMLSVLDQDRARNISQKMLEGTRSIGESHETIANALEEAGRALSCVRSVEETLGRARSTLASEFEARRADRSELVALTALFEQTSQELAATRQREAELQRRLTANEDALAEVRSARLQVELTASAREAEVSRLTTLLATVRAEGLEFKTSGDQSASQAQRLEDDNNRLRAKLDEGESRRQEAEAQAAAATQAHSLLDVERGVLERRIESMTGELTRGSRTVADLEAQVAADKARVRALEAAAQSASGETERLGRQIEEQAEKMRAQIEVAELRMATAQARTGRLEEDNAELSRLMQDAIARDRLAERENGELKLRLKQSEDQLGGLAADLTGARKELAVVEAARAAAVDRSDRLTETSEARLADVKRLEEQIDVLNSRHDRLVETHAKERGAFEAHAKTLSAAVERERSERHLASGALEAARKDRARLHIEVLKTGRGVSVPELSNPEGLEEKVS
jgi:crescentin